MLNDDKLLKSGFKRCITVYNGVLRWRSVKDGMNGEGRWGTVWTEKDGEGQWGTVKDGTDARVTMMDYG